VLLTHGPVYVGAALAVVLGVALRDARALVFAFAAEPLVRAMLSYVVCPFLPRLVIDRSSVRELLRFAGGVFGLPILILVFTHADVLVVGRYLRLEDLGMYALAWALAMFPGFVFFSLFDPMMLQLFSSVREDMAELRQAVVKVTRIAVVLGMPLAATMFVLARPTLAVVYGRGFSDAATEYRLRVGLVFGLLTLCMVLRVVSHISGQVYSAIGQHGVHRYFALIRAGLVVALIVPAVKAFGLPGAPRAILLASAIVFTMEVFLLGQFIGLGGREYVASLFPGMACSQVVAIPGVVLSGWLKDDPVRGLSTCGVLCVVAWIAGLVWLSTAQDEPASPRAAPADAAA
jgi:PST family polysaccharide transporter